MVWACWGEGTQRRHERGRVWSEGELEDDVGKSSWGRSEATVKRPMEGVRNVRECGLPAMYLTCNILLNHDVHADTVERS